MGYNGARGIDGSEQATWAVPSSGPSAEPVSTTSDGPVPALLVGVLLLESVLFVGAAFTGNIPPVVITLFRALLTL